LNPSRLKTGDIIALAGGVLLIVSLFLDWFGGSHAGIEELQSIGVPGGLDDRLPEAPSVSGWDSLEFIDFVLLLTGLVAIKQAGVRVAGLKARAPFPMSAVTTAFGGVAMTLILWRIFDPVGDGDLEAGIFIALASTVALSLGAYIAAKEEGFDFYEPDGDTGSGAGARKVAAAKPKAKPRINPRRQSNG
jgi:hypothetical protein